MPQHLRATWYFFGRKIQPFGFGVSMSMIVMSWALIANVAIGDKLDTAPGDVLGGVAILSAVLMNVGWVVKREDWMALGLLVAAGVWAGVFTILWLDIGLVTVSTLLALCWSIAAAGAWLLESDARRTHEG